jgi:tetratricopeptide (TPR) repeat protein
MEEARSLVGDMSLRQRAAFLSGLALQYRFSGDLERSIRVGQECLALYRAADAELEEAALENNMAINFIDLRNSERAQQHLARARELAERHSDDRLLSEIAEAESRLAMTTGDLARAEERAQTALIGARESGSMRAAAGAHLTLARLAETRDARADAEDHFGAAADIHRDLRSSTQLRGTLAEWAELRSRWGDIEGANRLYAEALGRASGSDRS